MADVVAVGLRARAKRGELSTCDWSSSPIQDDRAEFPSSDQGSLPLLVRDQGCGRRAFPFPRFNRAFRCRRNRTPCGGSWKRGPGRVATDGSRDPNGSSGQEEEEESSGSSHRTSRWTSDSIPPGSPYSANLNGDRGPAADRCLGLHSIPRISRALVATLLPLLARKRRPSAALSSRLVRVTPSVDVGQDPQGRKWHGSRSSGSCGSRVETAKRKAGEGQPQERKGGPPRT